MTRLRTAPLCRGSNIVRIVRIAFVSCMLVSAFLVVSHRARSFVNYYDASCNIGVHSRRSREATQYTVARLAAGLDAGQTVEVPRRFLALPQDDYLGPGFDLARVLVPRQGSRDIPLNFMLDSALTTSMLAPHVATLLGLDSDIRGDEAGARSFIGADSSQKGSMVRLEGTRLDCGTSLGPALGGLQPLVVEFPQWRIGQELGFPVDGMLGMEFYQRFAIEVNGEHLRLHEASSAADIAVARSMDQLSTALLPARLMGVEVALVGRSTEEESARVLGVLDTGASHTVLNKAAARMLLGLSEADIEWLAESEGGINAYDISGRPIDMPIVNATLELRGAGVEPFGSSRFDSIEVALGDFALFARLLGGDATQPAALIGQDILVQKPMLFAASQCMICFR